MAEQKPLQVWELWYPEAGATGLPFARGRMDPAEVLWAHAVPPTITVVVRDREERVIARGEGLKRAGERFPMTRFSRLGEHIRREDRWPNASDLGSLVILPGGEVGTLIRWWNADDGSEWRWQIEFYNHA